MVEVLWPEEARRYVAIRTEPKSVRHYVAAIGELTDVPSRSKSRGPPSWKSKVLRPKAFGDAA
jgi:hypothetical protein